MLKMQPKCRPGALAGAVRSTRSSPCFLLLAFGLPRDPVPDLNATLLHLLSFDHTKLTYRFQGRDFRLTDVHGEIVHGLLA